MNLNIGLKSHAMRKLRYNKKNAYIKINFQESNMGIGL